MGFGAEVAAFAAEELFYDLDAPIVRVAADDCHLPYNSPEEEAIIPIPPTSSAAAAPWQAPDMLARADPPCGTSIW